MAPPRSDQESWIVGDRAATESRSSPRSSRSCGEVRERRDDEAERMAGPADPALVASAIEDALDEDS